MMFALAGNPNSGKTTLFNSLTGASGHVGNFPGVTVECGQGTVQGDKEMTVVDLPGVYALRPFSQEERVARDLLLDGKPDGIVNIVDATSLTRSLYLTLQLMELNLPMVLAVNMMDELEAEGGRVDARGLSQALGIPVVAVCAAQGRGIDQLIGEMRALEGRRPSTVPVWTGAVARQIDSLATLLGGEAEAAGMPAAFAAARLVEGDKLVQGTLRLSPDQIQAVEQAARAITHETGLDPKAALADARYRFIQSVCRGTVVRGERSPVQVRSDRIDRLLMHRVLAIPIFLVLLMGIFYLTFGPVGGRLSDLLATAVGQGVALADSGLDALGIHPALKSLVVDGVLSGVGSVLGFLPLVLTLFFFLSLLEDSGYMARIAFIMDRPLAKFGLTGRSFVPMVLGFGCTVPAVLSARTLGSERDRRLTILLTPFMSCSAKLPIYAVFTAAFFPSHRVAVMLGLYLLGVGVGLGCSLVLQRMGVQGEQAHFMLELPRYRMPRAANLWRSMRERAGDFVVRAFTLILLVSVLIWFLEGFNYRLVMVDNPRESLLGTLGMAVSPLFAPLGFGDWRAVTALITGFAAKETVVSTLAVLLGTGIDGLSGGLSTLFTPASALSFLVFTLLYTPCVAAIAAARREAGSGTAAGMVLLQCTVAWMVSALVYHAVSLIGLIGIW